MKDLKSRNKEFFEVYGLILKMKEQISAFNHVVSQIARKIFEEDEKKSIEQTIPQPTPLPNNNIPNPIKSPTNNQNPPKEGSLFQFIPTG